MDCKYYQDGFCTNADSPCVADWCPCTQYPTLCKYCEDPQGDTITYNQLYQHWLKTKRKRKKAESEQLPGQLDIFDVIDKENKND